MRYSVQNQAMMGRFLYLSSSSLPISEIMWKFQPIFYIIIQNNHNPSQIIITPPILQRLMMPSNGLFYYFSTLQLNQVMIKLQGLASFMRLTSALEFAYRNPKKIMGFQSRINFYNRHLDQYDRKFLIRPPNLQSKNPLTFPITIPIRVRHKWNPKKREGQFIDNTEKIHWNRLTPNEVLLGFQRLDYLEYEEMIEGLKTLSEIEDQDKHDWNAHAWVSKAFDSVNTNFHRIKKKDYLPMYYLMKKLKCNNKEFWKKIYTKIQEMVYDLYPSQFEKFFLRYYKISEQYFSPEMKDKFLTLMEGRLRSFQPSAILKVYQIYQDENKLDDYWKYNVFIPLFKSQQYTYRPKQLYKIFRNMLIINQEKDDRLYASLYKRLTSYQKLTIEEIEMFQEVLQQIKDLFISHRVDPYIQHLDMMKRLAKKAAKNEKKEIPIQELVRQDIVFMLNKHKILAEKSSPPQPTT